MEIYAEDFGIHLTLSDIKGGLGDHNATTFMNILNNHLVSHPIAKTICLNAAVIEHLMTSNNIQIFDLYKIHLDLISSGECLSLIKSLIHNN